MLIDSKNFLILQGALVGAGLLSYHFLTNILGKLFKDTPERYLTRVYDTERVFRMSQWLFLLVWAHNTIFSGIISSLEGVSNKPFTIIGQSFTVAAGLLARYASKYSDKVLAKYLSLYSEDSSA